MSAWLAAFVFTQVIEIPIYAHAMLRREGSEAPVLASWPAALAVAFAASALTHPIVWFVMPELVPERYLLMVGLAEAFAVLVEAAWLRAFGLRPALLWALFANATSLSVGLASRRMFGWP